MDLVEIMTPAAPGSLMRAVKLDQPGIFRLARRDCELYSVLILCAGSWGRIRITNGKGRAIFLQPSTFTGSFPLGAHMEGGMIVEIHSVDNGPELNINWREADRELV